MIVIKEVKNVTPLFLWFGLVCAGVFFPSLVDGVVSSEGINGRSETTTQIILTHKIKLCFPKFIQVQHTALMHL